MHAARNDHPIPSSQVLIIHILHDHDQKRQPVLPNAVRSQSPLYSSSISTCLSRTFFLNSSISLSQSSAASPFKGEALYSISLFLSDNWFCIINSLVWLSKQALQTQQDGLDVVCSRPLVLQDIQADST